MNTTDNLQKESIFGRPAAWSTALPAVIVGGLAFLVALYGTFVLPRRLPASYLTALQQAQEQRPVDATTNDVEELSQAAGLHDVIYARLVGLEAGSPQRYFEWATFADQLASDLAARAADAESSASLTEQAVEQLAAEESKYRERARGIYEQLAAGESAYRDIAMIRSTELAFERFARGEAAIDFDAAADALAELLRRDEARPISESNSREAEETAVGRNQIVGTITSWERDRVLELCLELALEAAWQQAQRDQLATAGSVVNDPEEASPAEAPDASSSVGNDLKPLSRLKVDRDQLSKASSLLQEFVTGARMPTVRLEAVRGMLQAYDAATDRQESTQQGNGAADPKPASGRIDWRDRLAEIQLSCFAGQWTDVAFWLARKNTSNDEALLNQVCRQICRLAASELTTDSDSDWVAGYPDGLSLVAQATPYLPEFAEVIWQSAQWERKTSDHDNAAVVSSEIAKSIGSSQYGQMRHTVFALSNILNGKADVARSHLQLAQRSAGNTSLASRVAIWYLQSLPEGGNRAELLQLTQMTEAAVELDPENGLNWFALGALRVRLGEFEEALAALERARELLGKVSAIEELISSAQDSLR